MTRSIRDVLATLPDGSVERALDDNELQHHLRKHYDTEAERDRNARHARRDVFYRDGGVEVMCAVIDDVFQDQQVRELRKKWVKHARFANVIKHLVGELSTVYAEPAQRSVGGDEPNQAAFRALTETLLLDEQLDYANRMANLHSTVFVGPRVFDDNGERRMVLDFATPAVTRAVMHPQDISRLVALLVKVETRTARAVQRPVAWQLWSDHERIDLDAQFHPIGADVVHGLGVNRWVPLTYSALALPGFWPGEEGEDLMAAAISIWMAHVLLLKETKSATNQTVISGDVSTASRGQSMDTETPAVVPEGVSATSIDMSMDTEIFTRAADHILGRVGNGRGMALDMLKHQGVQSAEAREVLLEPLRALRRKQIKFCRLFERRLAKVMAAVAAKDAPALAFDPVDWRADYGEPQAITPKKQRMEEFIQAQQLGLDNILAFFMRENPDVTDPAKAREAISLNIQIRTWLVAEMQDFMRISGATQMRAPADTPPTPPGHPTPTPNPDTGEDGEDEEAPVRRAA